MYIDFVKIFKTPDELADFCCLPVQEQDAFIAKLVAEGKIDAELTCSRQQQAKPEQAAS